MIIQLFNKLGGLVWNLIIVVPIIKHIYDTKLEHLQALKLLRKILASLQKSDNSTLLEEVGASYAMSDAVKNGIVEFVCEIVKYLPANMWRTDEDDRDIFLNAIVHRQENIFSLLYGLGALKFRFVTSHDKFGNNMLHLAGMLAPPCRLDRVSGAALQLQRELQWFKGVEDMVPPVCRVEENEGGKKPRTLFTEQHVDLLKAGEKWMKSTARSCMLVATLIATVMFSAAFTTPGGTDQNTGIPLLLHHMSIRVFVISNAVSLYSSTTSVLMFLAILTSRYAEEDFLKSLPQKLIIGLSTLFLSMATMMTAYAAALAALYTQGLRWSTFSNIFDCLYSCFPFRFTTISSPS
ncbi:hypothetical protein L1049_001976 [Liquidambar formosana]|uniref:PGG domain-containing protein n=1 Tax=Liquidambar formosana TaxID=63359 RepID=A0AAP0NF48_LIQFO